MIRNLINSFSYPQITAYYLLCKINNKVFNYMIKTKYRLEVKIKMIKIQKNH